MRTIETQYEQVSGRPARIMLIGLGGLGSRILDGLIKLGSNVEIIAAGRDKSQVQVRVNLAMFSAMQLAENVARVHCVGLDLLDTDAMSEVLQLVCPDLIVHCATLQPYAAIAALPHRSRVRIIEAGLGPWLTTHLALTHRLMQAIKIAGRNAIVINCAYPDAVNPALAAIGAAPLIGTGNIANNEPAIRCAIADELAVDPSEVSLSMVMHHYVSHRIHRMGSAGGAPFHLSFRVGSRDRTKEIDPERLFALMATRYRREHREAGKLLPAGSTVALVNALLGSAPRMLHAPAPCGLVGGFLVEVSRGKVTVVPPPDLTVQRAIDINLAAQRFDGIDEIGADGVVTFTDEAATIFGEELGHQCAKFHVSDAYDWALELIAHCTERSQQ